MLRRALISLAAVAALLGGAAVATAPAYAADAVPATMFHS